MYNTELQMQDSKELLHINPSKVTQYIQMCMLGKLNTTVTMIILQLLANSIKNYGQDMLLRWNM